MEVVLTIEKFPGDSYTGDKTLITSSPRTTIGRSHDCDWALYDPDRFLSSHHCTLLISSKGVFLEDQSSNGTLVNETLLPIKQQIQAKLSNQDRFRIGEYLILVELRQANIHQELSGTEVNEPPFPDSKFDSFAANDQSRTYMEEEPWDVSNNEKFPTHNHSLESVFDALADPLNESNQLPDHTPDNDSPIPRESDRSNANEQKSPIRESAEALPHDWFSNGTDGISKEEPVRIQNREEKNIDPFEFLLKKEVPKEPEPQVSSVNSAAASDSLTAILKGLEIDERELNIIDPNKTLLRLGEMLRWSMLGIKQLLDARNQLKSELHLDRTTFSQTGNNPIKVSVSAKDALIQLIAEENEIFLSPEEAIQDANNDILAHQIAMLSGIQSALKSIIEEFNPKTLEEKLLKESPISANIPVQRQAKLWNLFEQHFATIQQQATDDFNRILANTFTDAYEEQLLQLKNK